jgi:hypothetical protein
MKHLFIPSKNKELFFLKAIAASHSWGSYFCLSFSRGHPEKADTISGKEVNPCASGQVYKGVKRMEKKVQ